jgi:hypothetical protein
MHGTNKNTTIEKLHEQTTHEIDGKVKVKLSRYTPWWSLGGEEV